MTVLGETPGEEITVNLNRDATDDPELWVTGLATVNTAVANIELGGDEVIESIVDSTVTIGNANIASGVYGIAMGW